VSAVLYYLGRAGQVIGMWILLVDVVTAGPMGPNPKLFGLGSASVGWLTALLGVGGLLTAIMLSRAFGRIYGGAKGST